MTMSRRVAVVLIFAFATFTQAQDREWLRTWEEAQRHRPRNLGSEGRIAPAGEPGTPLVIHGRVVQKDGVTPAPGIIVFAYQTDRTGVYNASGAPGWRLRGWARSDAQGRFTFHTIRPASYPAGRNPAHVHLTVEGPGVSRRWTTDLHFQGDPFLTERQIRESNAAGAFGGIRPVTVRGGVQHVDLNLRLSDDGRF